jgi:hypothetical protein
MQFTSKILLTAVLSALLATTVAAWPSTEPQVSEEIKPDVRQAFIAFIRAYNRGDGATAYEYLDTSLERSVLINGYRITPIPAFNLAVYSYDIDTLNLAYDLPHPGDILAAIQDGGDNPEQVRKNIDRLRYGTDFVRRFETWHVVRTDERIKFYFNNKGLLNLAARIGGQVDFYCTEGDAYELDTASFPGIPLSNRMVIMLMTYFDSYDIEITSIEGKRILKEIAQKFKTISETPRKSVPQISFKKVSNADITMMVPKTWINEAEEFKSKNPDALAYAHESTNRESLLVTLLKEGDINASPDLRDKTDSEMLTIVTFANHSNLVGELIDSGKSTIGGVPANYLLEYAKPHKQRLLTYLFVKDGVIYSLSFACFDEQYDSNYNLFMRIKDSVRFRH